jgi:hypothetical protein
MEELEQNKKVYIYSYIISFIVILGLFSLFIYKSNENKNSNKDNSITSTGNIKNDNIDINEALNS